MDKEEKSVSIQRNANLIKMQIPRATSRSPGPADTIPDSRSYGQHLWVDDDNLGVIVVVIVVAVVLSLLPVALPLPFTLSLPTLAAVAVGRAVSSIRGTRGSSETGGCCAGRSDCACRVIDLARGDDFSAGQPPWLGSYV